MPLSTAIAATGNRAEPLLLLLMILQTAIFASAVVLWQMLLFGGRDT